MCARETCVAHCSAARRPHPPPDEQRSSPKHPTFPFSQLHTPYTARAPHRARPSTARAHNTQTTRARIQHPSHARAHTTPTPNPRARIQHPPPKPSRRRRGRAPTHLAAQPLCPIFSHARVARLIRPIEDLFYYAHPSRGDVFAFRLPSGGGGIGGARLVKT